MRKRSTVSAFKVAVLAASVATLGLVVAPGVSHAAKPAKPYYLSLGDSYSVGYQPGMGATAGYTAYVAKKEKMTLENFGCGGATTSSLLTDIGCLESGKGPVAATNAVPYPTTTQAQAALDFIAAPANHGKVGLITISIGGNDVTSCANAVGGIGAILTCVNTADSAITANVSSLVSSLNTALTTAGDSAKVVGLTYPDVILGDWVYPSGSPNQTLAGLSVTAFDALINPALSGAYGAANFVNVTQAPYKKAIAGDDSDSSTLNLPLVNLAPYGKIPPAVWEICKLTYFCSLGNIHANTKGYTFIGQLVVAHLNGA
jgi:lysophospholipase L1-like esterase